MGSVLGWGKEKTLVAASPWGLFLSFHQMGYETYLSTVLLSCLLSCFLRPTSRRDTENRTSVVESNEARQKFAGAKAISSDMFFGREADAEVNALCSALTSFPVCSGCSLFRSFTFFLFSFLLQYEARSRLQQLSGSSAISSADLFGEAENAHSGLLALSGLRKGVQFWRTSIGGVSGCSLELENSSLTPPGSCRWRVDWECPACSRYRTVQARSEVSCWQDGCPSQRGDELPPGEVALQHLQTGSSHAWGCLPYPGHSK